MRKTTYWVFCAGFALVVMALVGTIGDGTQAQGRPDGVAPQAVVPQRPDGLGPQLVCGTPEPDAETVRLVEEYHLRRGDISPQLTASPVIPVYVHRIHASNGMALPNVWRIMSSGGMRSRDWIATSRPCS